MQTFILSTSCDETARLLDYKRLRNQINEATIIAKCLLKMYETRAWNHHRAVKMWTKDISYLVFIYIPAIIQETKKRGTNTVNYENNLIKVQETLLSINKSLSPAHIDTPVWFTSELILSHKSNLLRKDYEFYNKHFPGINPSLPYVWPV